MKVVSERLGHATLAFTIETYQHVLPGMQADAAKRSRRWSRPPLLPVIDGQLIEIAHGLQAVE